MNTSDISPAAQDYEDLVRQFYVPFNTGDVSIYDRILASNWIDDPLSPGQQQGPDGFKAKVTEFRQNIPGYHVTNDEFLVAGNKAAVHSTVRSTLRGAKSSDPPFEMRTCDFHHIEDGKIVYTWHLEDFYGLFQYLGVIPGR
jgi:ketosteroid isomerase-like protein